jgi:hypothetical protein
MTWCRRAPLLLLPLLVLVSIPARFRGWHPPGADRGVPGHQAERACYAILDTLAPAAEFVRVEYDLPRVTAAIRASELPPEFAADLETAGAAQTPSR